MSTLFLVSGGVAVVFYVVFLIECSRPRRTARKVSVRKSAPNSAVDSAYGPRFLVHLEREMAEFVTPHGLSASRQRGR